ncbi:4-hydroxy-2-oxovalerate aldolase [Streptomyces violaceusniger]|uniref:4-hydroxy-2-oxohexanoate aldolase n=1 Tax=Streptomyces violaceusniger TaxID=68280 RepID=A0A4D4KT90_STRVO|nr:4-hydroxy-2-oxovalerate aldolase [Streptomyces violaceusniger]
MTRPVLRGDVRIIDTTLRDGSHAVAHRSTETQVRDTVRAHDAAGMEWIEVSHGDGVGGSSFNYGFSGTDEMSLINAAREEARRAKIAVLPVPGIGTVDDLKRAHDAGAEMVRVATHCTEADVSPQHFAVDDARARFEALVAEVGDEAWVGYHGHQNMGLGVANSVIAHEAGVRYIDGSLCALGAGAGNSPTEVLGAVFDRLGVATGLDAGLLLDAAEEVVRPYLSRWPKMDRNAIVQGWAGVYSSFLLHAERAAERYKVPAHAILRRCGERGYVGGQEDMIIAIGLAEEQTT